MQTLRKNKCQPRLLHPAKLSITVGGENKIFYDNTKFKFSIHKYRLQKTLGENLQPKEVNNTQENTNNNNNLF